MMMAESTYTERPIAIFGGTGASGRKVVRELLDRGYRIRLLVRTPAAAADLESNSMVTIVPGDVLDLSRVVETIQGCSAVISTIGHTTGSPPGLQQLAYEYMASAMVSCGVRRIIVLTGAGIHLPGDHPTWIDRAMSALIRVMARNRFNDGHKAIRKLIGTDLDWTIVRTELQHNGVGSNVGHVGPVGDPAHSLRCSRGYIAQFIADCLANPTYIRSTPKISD